MGIQNEVDKQTEVGKSQQKENLAYDVLINYICT